EGFARNRFGDAGALDLHPHAQPAAAAEGGLGPRDRFGDARIVERALFAQSRDRRVDGVGFVALALEALSDLRFGQLAPREHLQSINVRGHDEGAKKSEVQSWKSDRSDVTLQTSNFYDPVKRVISGFGPVDGVDAMAAAICSRAAS